jgi:hypothetical protein
MTWIAGADGCKAGWIVGFAGANDDVRIRVVAKFADIFTAPEQPRVIAVVLPYSPFKLIVARKLTGCINGSLESVANACYSRNRRWCLEDETCV